ncbi:hypothetical protein [Promicromonospora iranensis]|uniref:hypothetical protein n=1 Tax=Promicromonospora iranensis TaxID=1105144 RepID=UPI0023A9A299|nr:hypothetical protein [Promicromonospora iranensis]
MRRAALAVVAALVLLLAVAVPRGPAWAAWADTATVATGALSAGTIPTTTTSCGTLGVGSVTFTWTAVPGATGYVAHFGAGGASTQTLPAGTTQFQATGVITSGTFYVEVQRQFAATTWTSVPSNSRTYTVVALAVGVCL